MHIQNADARNWYLKEAAEQMWSYATLNRNISTMYYERLLMSQQKIITYTNTLNEEEYNNILRQAVAVLQNINICCQKTSYKN